MLKHNFDEISPSTSGNRRTSNQFGLNKNEFLKCCVGLVAVENLSIRIFDDKVYFKKILSPYEKQYNIHLNSRTLVEYTDLSANKIKTILKNCFPNKMISLKIDVATRMDKSILVINVQYIKDFKIVVNTIGMIQLKKKDRQRIF